jgi:hypothetical protein
MLRLSRALAVLSVVVGAACSSGYGEGTPAPAGDGGAATDGDIEISPSTLDFGDVPCSTESSAQLITIRNKSTTPTTYKVQLPEGTAYRLEGNPDGILPGQATITLSLFAKTRAVGDNAADLLVLAGETLQTVHATAKGTGATFEIAESTIDFGEVRKENGASRPDVVVQNNGTVAASIAGFAISDPAFDVAWPAKPAALVVPPGGSTNLSVQLKAATTPDASALTATVTPMQASFCGPAPALQLKGRRVTTDVTVSPADFGKQPCNTSPAAKAVVISNYSASVLTYSLAASAAPSFTIVDQAGGSVAPALPAGSPATANILVTPKKLPASAPLPNITEQLVVQITSTAPGASGPRNVLLHVDVRGAIISATPSNLAFISTGPLVQKTFTVTNTGNELVYFNWPLTRTGGGGPNPWTISAPSTLAGGASGVATVGFKGSTSGSTTATVKPGQLAIFGAVAECQPLPSIALTGTKP